MAKTNKRRDAERRSAAAARVAEMRKAQLAAERRRRTLTISGVVVGVLVLVAVIAVVVGTRTTQETTDASAVSGATSDYGFTVGKPDAPVDVVVYEDFQCPICAQFEQTSAPTLQKYVDNGTISVEYRPIAILDRASSTDYSTRALNAAACVVDNGDEAAFTKFHQLLFANQPPEGGDGLTDEALAGYAEDAGAGGKVTSCIDNEDFKGWTASATDAASKADVTGTPTIRIDGEQVKDWSPASLSAAIEAAAGNK